jgi:protein-tyrosine phosphatase
VIYAGCMGGIGRTGLLFGGLTKVAMTYRVLKAGETPKIHTQHVVDHVRQTYYHHAIETMGQQEFLTQFDAMPIARWLMDRSR